MQETSVLKSEFNYNIYNDLWSVEESNKEVNRNNYDDKAEFLKKSARLLAKYDLIDKLGIRLLHKHSKVEINERMIESERNVHQEKALVTEPIKDSANKKAIPSVWTIMDNNFFPLEYTTDPLASQIFSDLEMPESFLKEYQDQVNSSPIGKYLGLSIVRRGFFETGNDEDFPLEYTDEENRSNVIFLRHQKEVDKAIETAWAFRRDIDVKLACESKSYCTSRCTIGCQSVEGGHEKFHMGPHHGQAYEHTYVGI